MGEPEILNWFPALRDWPRVTLGTGPTVVERITLPGQRSLLVKRDDRYGDPIGGNKVRGLEWLLGGVRDGDRVLTVGPRGSTHALATSTYAARLGARVAVVRWNQEMNRVARLVDERLRRTTNVIDAGWVGAAYALAVALRATHPRNTTWIPAGGATPRAIVGHVSAALELVKQVERGECPQPARVVVPLGSGGTAAGLWLGFSIAGAAIDVVGVRVVPRLVGRVGRVRRLAKATARLLRKSGPGVVPDPDSRRFRIEERFFGGAYGRPLPGAADWSSLAGEVVLDDTYSAKAYRAALAQDDRGETLLWLTFDGRVIHD